MCFERNSRKRAATAEMTGNVFGGEIVEIDREHGIVEFTDLQIVGVGLSMEQSIRQFVDW
jgi:hypothetical protein